jgi:hypothetical protein
VRKYGPAPKRIITEKLAFLRRVECCDALVGGRKTVAGTCGVGHKLWDGVHRYNAEGLDGLANGCRLAASRG